MSNHPSDTPDPNVRHDIGGWISGPSLPGPGDTVTELLDRLRSEHPGWQIHAHPLGLGLWTAEHRSEGGRSVHYLVAYSGEELADKPAAAAGGAVTRGSCRTGRPGDLRRPVLITHC